MAVNRNPLKTDKAIQKRQRKRIFEYLLFFELCSADGEISPKKVSKSSPAKSIEDFVTLVHDATTLFIDERVPDVRKENGCENLKT